MMKTSHRIRALVLCTLLPAATVAHAQTPRALSFKNQYTVYRLGNNKGFRVVGEIDQNTALLHMPVMLRIDTDGKTVLQRIDVVGLKTHYVVDTFGRPRKITLAPESQPLKNTP